MGDPSPTIANPKLEALHTALSSAKGVAGYAETRLDDTKSAFLAGAWSGTSESDAFFSELGRNITALKSAGEDCVANVQAKIDSTPATIPNPAAASGPN